MQIGDQSLSGNVTITAGAAVSIEETIAADGDVTIAQTIDVSALRAIFMVCTKPLSVEFVGPNFEVALETNVPFCWFIGNGIDNPFGATDVTSIHVLEESGDESVLQIEILHDPTP
jgi:hypothetical protein